MKNERTAQRVRKTNKMEKMLKVVGNLFTFVNVLFLMWLVISFIDVNLHNTYPGGVADMLPWNAFTLFVEYFG